MKRKIVTGAILALAIFFEACNASTVQAYINLAVGIALQVAKLAGLPANAANQISADLATANKFIADLRVADAKAKPGILSEIDTYLNVAQSDLSGLLAAARVSDPKLQAVIQASIGIAITAVESIYQLENVRQPSATAKVLTATLPGGGPGSKPLTPAQLKALYNQTVAAYPQAQLH